MLIKLLISAIVALILWFLLRKAYFRFRYYNRYNLVINLYNMLQKIEETTKEYGKDVSVIEVELKYGLYRKNFANIYDVYKDIERLCKETLEYQKEFENNYKSIPELLTQHERLISICNGIRLKLWESEEKGKNQNEEEDCS